MKGFHLIALVISIFVLFSCTACQMVPGASNQAGDSNAVNSNNSEEQTVPSMTQHQHAIIVATCTAPSYCTVCGETFGEPLGHDLQAATCELPQSCTRCSETVGEPLGHDFQDASCELPQVCSRCGKTVGEALGHDYSDDGEGGTKKCSRCRQTDPNSIPISLKDVFLVDSNMAGYTEEVFTDSYGYTYDGAYEFSLTLSSESFAVYNLDKKYSEFSAAIVAGTNTKSGDTYYYKIYADDQLVYTSAEHTKTTAKEEFSINVTDTQLLKIELHCSDSWSNGLKMFIVDAYLHQ